MAVWSTPIRCSDRYADALTLVRTPGHGEQHTKHVRGERIDRLLSKGTGWLRRLRTAQPDAARAKPFFPVAIQAPRTPADDLLMDDEPSRGQLLRALDTVAREKGIKGI